MLGGIVFIVASWPVASHAAPVVAVATALGATATAIIGYLQSERVLRPVAVAALRGGVPENFRAAGGDPAPGADVGAVHRRAGAGDRAGGGGQQVRRSCMPRPTQLFTPILMLALLALAIGLAGTVLVAMSIADPLRQLRWALGEVQRGNYNAHMQIYDASELGLLQAGFNDMVRDLRSGSDCATCSAATSARTWPVVRWSAVPNSAGRSATSRCCSSTSSARPSWRPPARPARS